jgi:methionine synthase I (cobalamin-dependent)/5,10-methylenetetrahydrofolate reductase
LPGLTDRFRDGRPLVGDGGVGALVALRSDRLRFPEEGNLRDPEAVLEVHLDFLRAGADVISANTFGANRFKLAQEKLDDSLAEIVERGVKLAREAREIAGVEALVAGSIGPTGDVERMLGPDEQHSLFAEQAKLLHGRGVDLLTLETFSDLDELAIAVDAVRGVTGQPLVCMLTFDESAETLAGVEASDAYERLAALRVDAVGANCGLGPQSALEALAEMSEGCRRVGIPLAVAPNAGLPTRSAGRLVYPNATAEYFAEFAAQAVALGARLVGGCCGTTPVQIAGVRQSIDEAREPRTRLVAVARETRALPAGDTGPTRLEALLDRGEWVVSVELDPPKGANLEAVLETATTLRDSGRVHVVDVNDNPMARARMSALVASAAIELELGLETIPHVTPRDATVMGLESQLLGAHSQGIRNILAVTGDHPHVGDYPGSHGVYEVDSIGLTSVLSRLNAGRDYSGKAIDAPTSFYVGVAVNPSAEDIDTELERFRRKVEAGARFGMTQALFDLEYLDRFLDALGGESPIPLLVGVWQLTSFQLAFRIHNEVPGIIVPERVQQRLADAGSDAGRVGLELARELLEGARSRAAGTYLIPPFKQPLAVLELLES